MSCGPVVAMSAWLGAPVVPSPEVPDSGVAGSMRSPLVAEGGLSLPAAQGASAGNEASSMSPSSTAASRLDEDGTTGVHPRTGPNMRSVAVCRRDRVGCPKCQHLRAGPGGQRGCKLMLPARWWVFF